MRVRAPEDRSFEGALLRLRDRLASERQLSATGSRLAGVEPSAPPEHPRPWEMTRREFEAAAEPRFERTWGGTGALQLTRGPGHRFLGLSQSVLRHEIHFVLRCPGSPPGGYGVRVPAGRLDLEDQPHQAFVEAALLQGYEVPHSVLREYPDVGSSPFLPAPRLDIPRG